VFTILPFQFGLLFKTSNNHNNNNNNNNYYYYYIFVIERIFKESNFRLDIMTLEKCSNTVWTEIIIIIIIIIIFLLLTDFSRKTIFVWISGH